jgi:hypothetical protein
MDVVLGRRVGPGVGELGVVAGLCRLVPVRLLQQLVVGLGLARRPLSGVLPAPPASLPRGRRSRSGASARRDSATDGWQPGRG